MCWHCVDAYFGLRREHFGRDSFGDPPWNMRRGSGRAPPPALFGCGVGVASPLVVIDAAAILPFYILMFAGTTCALRILRLVARV